MQFLAAPVTTQACQITLKMNNGTAPQPNRYRTLCRFFLLAAVLPNLLEMLLIFGAPLPFGFVVLVMLSFYYLPVAAIFGDALFLTETVVAPHGIPGLLASFAVYSAPFLV